MPAAEAVLRCCQLQQQHIRVLGSWHTAAYCGINEMRVTINYGHLGRRGGGRLAAVTLRQFRGRQLLQDVRVRAEVFPNGGPSVRQVGVVQEAGVCLGAEALRRQRTVPEVNAARQDVVPPDALDAVAQVAGFELVRRAAGGLVLLIRPARAQHLRITREGALMLGAGFLGQPLAFDILTRLGVHRECGILMK